VKATCLNCTLKRSPEESSAASLSDVVMSVLRDEGIENRVAGVVVVGNEDGAHHCISEISGALMDIGYTIPGQAWTYWNKGPGPGDEVWLTTDEREWSITHRSHGGSQPSRRGASLGGAPAPGPAARLTPHPAQPNTRRSFAGR